MKGFKMKKQFSLLLLCSVLLLSLLVSCSSNPDVPGPGKSSEEGSSSQIDFLGKTFTASTEWSTFEPFDEIFGTMEYDRLLYKKNTVEAEFNCVLKNDLKDYASVAGDYLPRFLSGNLHDDVTVQIGSPNNLLGFVNAEMIVALNDYDFFDWSDELHFGSEVSRQTVSYYGNIYAFTGKPQAVGGYFCYNKDLSVEYGISDPQELYEKRQWTFDTFADMMPLASDFTDPDFKIYALGVYPGTEMLPVTAIFANGGKMVGTDGSGKLKVGFTDPEAVYALEWVAKIEKTGYVFHESDYSGVSFDLGRSMFYLTQGWTHYNTLLSDSVKEFDYIPFPYGPNGEYGTSSAYFGSTGGIAIFDVNEPNETAVLMNRWMTFEEYSEDLLIDETYTRTTEFYTDESYSNFLHYSDTDHYIYANQLGSVYNDTVLTALDKCTRGGKGVAESLSSVADKVQTALDQLN